MTSPTAGAPHVDLHGRSPWSVLPPLVMGFFMIMVDTTIVNIAIPSLVRDFDATLTTVGWVNSAYLLSFAVLMLPAGRLGDRLGQRGVFISGLVVFTAASLLCGLSGSIGMLIAARAVQGVGAALMTPQTMATITRVFPPTTRGAAMGVWGAVAGLATITGPVLGGIFVETIGWEWIFFVNIPVGVVALVLSVRYLPHLPRHTGSVDLLGTVLSVVGLSLLVFGLQEGETYHWGTITGPITVWGLIGVGVLVLVAFVLVERRLGDDALLPLRLFHHRNFSLANVDGMAISFAMIGLFFPLTLYLQSVVGFSPLKAAMVNLPASVLSGFVAPMAGRLSDRVAGKWVVLGGFLFIAVAVVWVHGILAVDVSLAHLMVAMLPFGIGTGLVFSPLANVATSGLDGRTAGAGAGAFNTTRQVGGVIGSAAVVAMLTGRLATAVPDAARQAAAALPEQARGPFVDAFAKADFSGGSVSAPTTVPDGLPASLADQLRAAAQVAVGQGFTTAVRDTLLLIVGVLLLGAVVALLMDGGRATTNRSHVDPALEEARADRTEEPDGDRAASGR